MMRPSVRAYLAGVGGFALALLLAALLFAVLSAATYRYSANGEFQSRSELISFVLFAWGGLLLSGGAAGFAAGFAPALRFAQRLRLPVLFGFVAGVVLGALGVVGYLGAVYRAVHVHFLLVEAGFGLAIGAITTVVAALATRFFPKSAGT